MNDDRQRYRAEASELAERLVHEDERTREPGQTRRDLVLREGLYLADVEEEVSDFFDDLEYLKHYDLQVPAVRVGERRVPIALRSLPSASFPGSIVNGVSERWRAWAWKNRDRVDFLNPNHAVEIVTDGLREFLTARIATVVEFFEGKRRHAQGLSLSLPKTFFRAAGTTNTVGFSVDVVAVNTGLRIHVSPTFRRSWRVFGMPTNPVVNTLTGGIYEFGADSGPYGSSTITPDPGTFDIPYQTVSPRLTL